MLSRFFNSHKRSVSTLILGLTVVLLTAMGCGGKAVEVTTPQDHPTNPNAPQVAFSEPANVLMAEKREGDGHHSRAALSPDGTEALKAMLDAYFAIGDQLAADTMDDVNAKAHTMLEALYTLAHEDPAALMKQLHNVVRELIELSDIKAARVAYGSLSDSFKHFIVAVGLPVSYQKQVYSYVCGMASDVPEGGIWMQIGESVRNPYFGSAMLKCHSSKMQMFVPSTDMSGSEEMKPHEHIR